MSQRNRRSRRMLNGDAEPGNGTGATAGDERILKFQISDAVIKHLIESQAENVPKALLETVMNSIDAGANAIRITIENGERIVIEDDGRGFANAKEVEKHFGTFGFDHETNEEQARGRELGRFGLGRGQIMAFASTVWETNRFTMRVNIRRDKFRFRVIEHDNEVYPGCRIEAKLYEPVGRVAQATMIAQLSREVKYATIPIEINGKRVNTDADEMRWTTRDERVLFQLNEHSQRGVDIYNLGIFVTHYTHSECGVSGVVVSRKGHPFTLNTTRTGIIHGRCPVWKAARRMMSAHSAKRRKKTALTDEDRIAIIGEALRAERADPHARTLKLIETVNGRYSSIEEIERHAGGAVTVAPASHSPIAEYIHGEHFAAVLSAEMPSWFNVEGPTQLIHEIQRAFPRPADQLTRITLREIKFEDLAEAHRKEDRIVDLDACTKVEKAIIVGLNQLSYRIHGDVVHRMGQHIQALGIGRRHRNRVRKVLPGESETADAWTDGKNFIVVDRGTLRRYAERGLNGWAGLTLLIVHEYLHDGGECDRHAHGLDFYRAFHDITGDESSTWFETAVQGLNAYLRERKRLGLRETRKDMRTLDRLDAVNHTQEALAR